MNLELLQMFPVFCRNRLTLSYIRPWELKSIYKVPDVYSIRSVIPTHQLSPNIIPQIQIVQSKNNICTNCDYVIFYGFCNAAWDTIIPHRRFTVGYYSISHVTRGHHALKQTWRSCTVVCNFVQQRFIDLTIDFQDILLHMLPSMIQSLHAQIF
jgi:hypothetical protein